MNTGQKTCSIVQVIALVAATVLNVDIPGEKTG